MSLKKEKRSRDLAIEEVKLVLEIDQKELELTIFHKVE